MTAGKVDAMRVTQMHAIKIPNGHRGATVFGSDKLMVTNDTHTARISKPAI